MPMAKTTLNLIFTAVWSSHTRSKLIEKSMSSVMISNAGIAVDWAYSVEHFDPYTSPGRASSHRKAVSMNDTKPKTMQAPRILQATKSCNRSADMRLKRRIKLALLV